MVVVIHYMVEVVECSALILNLAGIQRLAMFLQSAKRTRNEGCRFWTPSFEIEAFFCALAALNKG